MNSLSIPAQEKYANVDDYTFRYATPMKKLERHFNEHNKEFFENPGTLAMTDRQLPNSNIN